MQDLNPTTQTFPRQAGHFHPDQVTIHGPYTPAKDDHSQAQFWVYITLAFAAGFLFSHLWG